MYKSLYKPELLHIKESSLVSQVSAIPNNNKIREKMLQHPGNRISLESYDVEVGFCALMHTHEGNHMGRILSPSKGTSGCLSRCFSYYSFSVSVTPSQVPH